MPSKFEAEEPLARTEAERRADRCFDAYFVFETMPESEFARREALWITPRSMIPEGP